MMTSKSVSVTTFYYLLFSFTVYACLDATQHAGYHRFAILLGDFVGTLSSTILYFSADHPNCAKFLSMKCSHISLWLNPTGHSKFHSTSNHPPPATDSGLTAYTPLYPPVQVVPPPLLPFPLFFVSRTE